MSARRALVARLSDPGGLAYCVRVFLALRIGVSLLALAGVGLLPQNQPTPVTGWPPPEEQAGWDNLGSSLERWDALWFLRIADNGYAENDGSAAFFPAYPLVTRGLSFLLGGHPLAAATLISNVALIGALYVLYRLTKLEYDEVRARRAILYLALFPTAFFLVAPYSESLFLLAACTAVLCARTKRWGWAALAGALASATRSIGVVLVPALAIEAWMQRREDAPPGSKGALVYRLLCSAGAGVGTVAYLAYWKAVSGNWFAPVGEQGNWQRELTSPLATLIDGTRVAFDFIGQGAGGYQLLDWIVVVPVIAAALWVVINTRPIYGVYTALSLLLPLTFIFNDRPFMSLPRFALVVWPVYWAFSVFAARLRATEVVGAVSAAGLGLFTVLFVNWYWIF